MVKTERKTKTYTLPVVTINQLEEMQKCKDDFVNTHPSLNEWVAVREFMEASINQHKDHIDRMARIEKAIAELQSGEMQEFHDKIYENNLDNRKELKSDGKNIKKD